MENLGHFSNHWKCRVYTTIVVVVHVTRSVIFCSMATVDSAFDMLLVTYAVHANYLHVVEMFCAMMMNFILSALTIRQRLHALGKCITELKSAQMNLQNVSVLSVLPPVESSGSQFTSDNQIRQIQTICRELFGALRMVAEYYNTSVAEFVINLIGWFTYGAFFYNSLEKSVFISITSLALMNAIYTCLSFLSCTLLESEIRKVKISIARELNLSENKKSRKQLKYMYCRIIHEDKAISCGLFDFNLNLIPTIFNLIATLVFAVIQK